MTAVIWPDGGGLPAPDQLDSDELAAAYRDLSLDDAAELAKRAVGVLHSSPEDWARQRAVQVLTAITCLVPASLRHVHHRLLNEDVFIAPDMPVWAQLDAVVFRDADPAVRDRLIGIAGRTVPGEWDDPATWRHGLALTALAWIGDERVQAAFHAGELGGDARWAAHLAGWDLTADGGRQNLGGPICRPLLDGLGPADAPAPVRALYPFDSPCPSCGRGLTVVLNLDLADPELWFLGLAGERLRVVTCLACVPYGVTLSEVDLQGNVRSFEPSGVPDDDRAEPPEVRPVRLGEPDPTPFAATFRERDPGSQVGGHPHWAQNPEYPRHGVCGRAFHALGQVNLGTGGLIYAFLDLPCGIVACQYQED